MNGMRIRGLVGLALTAALSAQPAVPVPRFRTWAATFRDSFAVDVPFHGAALYRLSPVARRAP